MKLAPRIGRLAAALAGAALLASLAGCGDSGSAGGTHPEPTWDHRDPALAARLDEAFTRWVEENGVIGAAAAVWTPGWLDWSSARGVQNVDTQEPFALDTVGRVASATKPFTATLILQLREEGRLSLDTRLSEYVPDYPNGDAITIEHLLRHRSGIPELQLADGFFIVSAILNDSHWITPEETLAWTYLPIPMLDFTTGALVPREPTSAPGAAYRYSQPGYIALGLIVEKITGQALADVYAERILAPLGLDRTHLPREGEPFDPAGYTDIFGILPFRIPGGVLLQSANSLNSASWSAGGMISSAGDLVTFLSALLEARLYSEESLSDAMDFMPTYEAAPGQVDEYGLGLYRHTRDGLTFLGHDGALPGSKSVMKYMEELDVYVGAVTNCDLVSPEGAPNLMERVARALRNEPQE